jgi:hypothetical protein
VHPWGVGTARVWATALTDRVRDVYSWVCLLRPPPLSAQRCRCTSSSQSGTSSHTNHERKEPCIEIGRTTRPNLKSDPLPAPRLLPLLPENCHRPPPARRCPPRLPSTPPASGLPRDHCHAVHTLRVRSQMPANGPLAAMVAHARAQRGSMWAALYSTGNELTSAGLPGSSPIHTPSRLANAPPAYSLSRARVHSTLQRLPSAHVPRETQRPFSRWSQLPARPTVGWWDHPET